MGLFKIPDELDFIRTGSLPQKKSEEEWMGKSV